MEVSEKNGKKLSWKRKLVRFHKINYVGLRKEFVAMLDLIPCDRIKIELNKGKSINVSLELIFYLLGRETIHEKITSYAKYKILLESDNRRFIVMKRAIQKIEVLKMMLEDYGIEKIKELDKREIELVKKYAMNLVKAKHGPENASCQLYEKGCNNMLCPMLSEPGIWYAEEDVCLNPEYKNNIVVINQKKLKKKHPEGYFTRDMLSKRFVIKSGISGIDPDVSPSIDARGRAAVDRLYIKREKQWNEAHRQISKATIEKQKTIVIKLANNLGKIRVVIWILEVKNKVI